MFSLMFLEMIFSVEKNKTSKNSSLVSLVPRSKLSFHKNKGNLWVLGNGLRPSQGVGLCNWWLMTWYYAFQAGGTCHLQPESMNLSKSWVSPSAYHKILHMSVFIHSVIYSKRYLPMYFPQYIGVCISCVYIHIHYVYTCVYIWYIQIHIKDRRREKRDDEYK